MHLVNLEKALQAKGYQLQDVQHVLLTHIHLDHAGAAWAFAEKGATIYMHPFGKKHMVDPSRLLASAKMIYKDQMDALFRLLARRRLLKRFGPIIKIRKSKAQFVLEVKSDYIFIPKTSMVKKSKSGLQIKISLLPMTP